MASLMEITLTSTYRSQVFINRWNYIANGTPAAVSKSFGLASAFGALIVPGSVPPAYPTDSILRAISELVHVGTVFQGIEVRAIYSPTDFYTTGFNTPFGGAAAAEGMSPAMAFGIRSSRSRSDVRRGTKRFGGVSEAIVGDGGVLTTLGLQLLTTVAQRMSVPLTYNDEGNNIPYAPCVVKKIKYIVNPDDPPAKQRSAYRYRTAAEGGEVAQLADCATSINWEVYNTIRTQTSRQYGRGI